MPHLSPMSWLFIPALIWLILLSMMISKWWQPNPYFKMKSLPNKAHNPTPLLWAW